MSALRNVFPSGHQPWRRSHGFCKSKQFGDRDPQTICQLFNHFDGRIAGSSFNVCQISPMQKSPMCEFFLRQTPPQPQVSDGEPEFHFDMFVSVTHSQNLSKYLRIVHRRSTTLFSSLSHRRRFTSLVKDYETTPQENRTNSVIWLSQIL